MTSAPGVVSIGWSPDSRLAAWSSGDGVVRQWDNEAACLREPFRLPSAQLVAYSEPVPTLLALSDAGKTIVRIVNAIDGKVQYIAEPSTQDSSCRVVGLTRPSVEEGSSVTEGGLSDDLHDPHRAPRGCFGVYGSGTVSIFHYSSQCLTTFPSSGKIMCVEFLEADGPDPRTVATGDHRGICRLWDIKGGKAECRATLKSHSAWITSLSFTPDGGRLASSSFDGSVRIWDTLARRAHLTTLYPEKSSKRTRLHAVSFGGDSDSLCVASSGADSKVRIWKVSSGRAHTEDRLISALTGHSASVFGLAFAPNGMLLASGSSDGFLRRWTLVSGSKTSVHGERALDISSSSAGHTLPHSGANGSIRLADHLIVYCPVRELTMACGMCSNTFDRVSYVPFVAACGHTYACEGCNRKLWNHVEDGEHPKCPECAVPLSDCSPNFDLLRRLDARRANGLADGKGRPAQADPGNVVAGAAIGSQIRAVHDDYIATNRLYWVEDQAAEVSSNTFSKTLAGHFDFEAASIKLPQQFGRTEKELAREAARRLERELSLLAQLRGPHVLQFYGASRVPDPDGRLLIVSESVPGGSLANGLELLRAQSATLSTDTLVSLACQLARSLLFFHRSDIARPTLDPSSLMLSHELSLWVPSARVKFSDLSCSVRSVGAGKSLSVKSMMSATTRYLAPEALDPESMTVEASDDLWFHRACKLDSYALGILLFELASGVTSWTELREAQIVAAVTAQQQRPGFIPGHVPQEMRDLIGRLWAQEADDRPSMQEAVTILSRIPSAPIAPESVNRLTRDGS